MKSSAQLCAYCKAQLGRPYWWGTFGQRADAGLLNQKRSQYPSQYGDWDFSKDFGKRVHDCCGLVKGFLWSDTPDSNPRYSASQDWGVRGFYDNCSLRGGMASMPDEPGVLLFRQGLGHMGVYMGGGKCIEAMGKRWGVVESELKSRNWAYWGKLNVIDYSSSQKPQGRPGPTYYYNVRLGLLKPGMEDKQVEALQAILGIEKTGIMDEKTVDALKDFQRRCGILCDGEAGGESWTRLLRG